MIVHPPLVPEETIVCEFEIKHRNKNVSLRVEAEIIPSQEDNNNNQGKAVGKTAIFQLVKRN